MPKLTFRPIHFDDIAKYEAYFAEHAPKNRWYNLQHLYIMRHRHHTEIAFSEHAIYLKSKIEGKHYFHKPIYDDVNSESICQDELDRYAKKHHLESFHLAV
ncbi:hypothetical protein [Pseudolactococcus insecticola]|uniref:Uncharacterized protein n=1 Tax=Pseudolactococcus insecticola TaxID=2709158 RepID=A0A6A0B493_9LACT|nr:hypothetical protein [Lactococcus insecticola]GFH40140.1 hypothetical protein Hs20B_05380 [Lactococcus insecticola]